jgi:hypothetical protein
MLSLVGVVKKGTGEDVLLNAAADRLPGMAIITDATVAGCAVASRGLPVIGRRRSCSRFS